jgi:opacity protein-like surface antigen
MRSSTLVVVVLALVSLSTAVSQTNQGAWEFSVSGAFASYSSKSENSGHTSESESQNIFSLLFRPGFFVIDGLEILPEVYWGAASDEPPSFSFSGNVAYNYMIPGARVAPFVLAGYGVGNGLPILERMLGRSSDTFDITVLNLGGGAKIFVTKAVALTAEYRYQQFGRDVSSGSSTTKYTYYFHNVFLGVSAFLP